MEKVKQQTAVQWVIRKICTDFIGKMPMHRWDEFIVIEHQALKMEREQIEQAFDDGYSRMSGWSMSDDYFDDNFQSDL